MKEILLLGIVLHVRCIPKAGSASIIRFEKGNDPIQLVLLEASLLDHWAVTMAEKDPLQLLRLMMEAYLASVMLCNLNVKGKKGKSIPVTGHAHRIVRCRGTWHIEGNEVVSLTC
jgi:hypothetical protein